MNERPPSMEQIRYLAKVLAGLFVLIFLGLASLALSSLAGTATAPWAAGLLAGTTALLLWLGAHRACQWAVGLVLIGLLVASALQTAGMVATVHPLAVTAGLVAAWGLGLCITHYRVS